MRWRTILLAGLLAGAFAACSDLSDNPLHALTRTGRDARVFNPQTGQYEWPKDEAPPRPHPRPVASGDSSSSEPSKPITPGSGDTRVYDPMKQQFVSPQ